MDKAEAQKIVKQLENINDNMKKMMSSLQDVAKAMEQMNRQRAEMIAMRRKESGNA